MYNDTNSRCSASNDATLRDRVNTIIFIAFNELLFDRSDCCWSRESTSAYEFESLIRSWGTRMYDNALVVALRTICNELNALRDRVYSNERSARIARSYGFKSHKQTNVLNRATVKLAEIDMIASHGTLLSTGRVLRFADLCSAPGEFLDYLFLRKKWSCSGYGITLPHRNGGLKLKVRRRASIAIPIVQVDVVSLARTMEDKNIRSKRRRCSQVEQIEPALNKMLPHSNFVRRKTNNVDLVLADGVTLNRQTSARMIDLLTSEWTIAKIVLNARGTFVVKTFNWMDDANENRTLDMLLTAAQSFSSFVVAKPLHFSALNDERYVVFKSYRRSTRKHNHQIEAFDVEATRRRFLAIELILALRRLALYEIIAEASEKRSKFACNKRHSKRVTWYSLGNHNT